MESNSTSAVLSLFLLLQLGGALALLLSGLYVLYCFNRAASSAERMADAAEAWLALQHYQVAQNSHSQMPEPNSPLPNAPVQPVAAEQVVIAKPVMTPSPVAPSPVAPSPTAPSPVETSASAPQNPNL